MNDQLKKDLLYEIEYQKKSLQRLENKVREYCNLKMYRIEIKDYKVTIPCKHCLDYGEIRAGCNKCGGKGTHAKTKSKWVVARRLEDIEKTTYDKEYGTQYWTSKSEFFSSKEKILYQTKQGAETECYIRNCTLD